MAIRPYTKGTTLIELVMVIIMSGIIFSSIAVFISKPILAYKNIVSRANLVQVADLAIHRLQKDIRAAVPNSLRVKTATKVGIEILNTVEAIKYRKKAPGVATDILDFVNPNSEFNTLGTFTSASLGANGYRLVIYNTGAFGTDSDDPLPGANVWSLSTSPGPMPPPGTHVISPSATTVTLSNPGSEGHVVLSSPFTFALDSPSQRMYVVDTPISYICDLTNNTLTRYSGYSISETQPIDPSASPLSSVTGALLANNVSACNFTYQPGTTMRSGILTVDLTVSNGSESVKLLHQIGVDNAP